MGTMDGGNPVSGEGMRQAGEGEGCRLLSTLRRRRRMLALSLIILLACPIAIYYWIGIITKPNIIGILRVEGVLLTRDQATLYSQAIREAILNNSIRGVVLHVDSPGGYADLIEQVYLDLLELRKRKPLVASITMALSGGYYISVASDYIYTHPTSMVGNIGVIGIAPGVLVPSERFLESGAHKVTGFSRLLFPFNLSRALDNFVNAVTRGRGDRLKLPVNVLRRGSVYIGSEAVGIGLVDELGSVETALRKVAQKAGVVEYSVVDLVESVRNKLGMKASMKEQVSWVNLTVAKLNEIHPPPSIYYLYLPADALLHSSSTIIQSPSEWLRVGNRIPPPPPLDPNYVPDRRLREDKNLVLVDMSHDNWISYRDLEVLARELILRNVTISFETDWFSLEYKLDLALAVIVAAPTLPYSEEKVERLRSFVEAGGVLVIMYDPAWEYRGPWSLWPANSLSMGFGILFGNGYLYDENRFFGMYRNIYIESFRDHAITFNLSRIVLFTSTSIYSAGKGVAWTFTTFSSVAERRNEYDVISVVELGKGAVVAIGDLTFMQEPFCHVEDNYKLVQNLVSMMIRK